MKFKDPNNNEYTIEFKRPDARRHGWCSGFYYYPEDGKGLIQVDPDMSKQMILNTLCHEVAHSFFEDATETDTTKFANVLSRLLYNKLKFRSNTLKEIINYGDV